MTQKTSPLTSLRYVQAISASPEINLLANARSAFTLHSSSFEVWTSAIKTKSSAGRGGGKKQEFYGIKKLRELILELAVRGLLVPQNPEDETASELLKKIEGEISKLIKAGKIKKGKKVPFTDEERPFKIPSTWIWTTLGEISEIGPRNTLPDSIDAGFVPMPLITNSYDGVHGQEIKAWGEIKKGYTHFANGDIAIAKITPCFENSKAAIFKDLENGYGAGTTELHVARLVGDFVSSRFILLYLKAPMFLEKGKLKMTGSAGQKRIPGSYFTDNPLPLPPLAEQHRIVAKVDELMGLCDKLEQQQEDSTRTHAAMVETLLGALTAASERGAFDQAWQRIASHFDTLFTTESSIAQLKQTILQLAVMGKLVEQDLEDEPAVKLLQKIRAEKVRLNDQRKIKSQKTGIPVSESEKTFKLPSSWEWCRLGDLSIQSDSGWSPQCESQPRNNHDEWAVLKVSAVTWGEFRPDENKTLPAMMEPRPESEVKSGDFLLSRANTEELVARGVIVEKTPPKLMMSDKIVRFVISDNISKRFVNLVNGSSFSRAHYIRNASGTSSSMKNVSRETISNLPIALPPIAEQHRIVAKVDELLSLCDRLKARLQSAQTTQLHLADSLVEAAIR